ncbi:MAG: YkgJ family cysteine cluster protein [Candidatus Bathyarchaeia archaeon]
MTRGGGRLLCKRCGWCCQNQLIGVSTVEIRAISSHLELKPVDELEGHIISCMVYDGIRDLHGIFFDQYLERLVNFYEPCEVLVKRDVAFVRSHVIRLLPESRRCVFHNPVTMDCLIYPARPLTCRMFPYEVKDGGLVMVDETDKCPGVGEGEFVNLRRHTALSKLCRELLARDDAEFWRFLREKGVASEDGEVAFAYRLQLDRVHLIDPFVEVGLVSKPRLSIMSARLGRV